MIKKLFLRNGKNYVMLVVATLFVTNTVFLLFVWLPFVSSIFDNKKILDETTIRLASIDTRRTHFLEIQKNLSQESALLKRIEDTLVNLRNPLSFIELLEVLGKEQGVLVELSVLPSNTKQKTQIQGFRISAEGAFPAVFQYLKILENVSYQLAFSEIYFDFITKESAGSKITPRVVTKMITDIDVRVR